MESNILEIVEKTRHKFDDKPQFSFPDIDNLSLIKIKEKDTISLKGLSIHNHGSQPNYILIDISQEKLGDATINFEGATGKNIIIIGERLELHGKVFCKGRDNILVFSGSNVQPVKLGIELIDANSCLVFWGKQATSSALNKIIMRGESHSCLVGDNCMFAYNIVLRTSDMHAIFDLTSGEKINDSGDIIINPHVWIGQDVLILKKSSIGFGSIIGAKSLVTGNIPAFCIAGGLPAKVIRHNCSWDRSDIVREETLEYVWEYKNHLNQVLDI